jgi:hypothetical protein
MPMSDIRRTIVAAYIGGVKRERMPKALMIWGAPGEGKTFTTIAACKDITRRLRAMGVIGEDEEVLLIDNPTSCLEPCDITGVPTPVRRANGEAAFTRYLALEWAWISSTQYEDWMRSPEGGNQPDFNGPPMILMFDDIPAAHFQTQTAFFKGVHEGKWGSLTQRDNVMVVGAGNRMEDNAGANDMPTALGNRFRHLYASPTTDDWLKWAGSDEGGIHPWVIAFIRTCKDALREFNQDVAMRAEKAFASCRTWEDVSEFLWEGEIAQSPETEGLFAKIVMGIVGRGTATEFLGFLRNTSAVIPPEEIVKNPRKARIPSKENLDALHATVASLELHIKQNPENWKAGVVYALRKEMLSDVGILLAQTVSEVIKDLPAADRANAMGDDTFGELFERYEDLIDAVNL